MEDKSNHGGKRIREDSISCQPHVKKKVALSEVDRKNSGSFLRTGISTSN